MHVSAAAPRGASDQSHSCPLVPAEVSQRPRVELLTLFSFLYNDLATQAQAVLIFVLFLFFQITRQRQLPLHPRVNSADRLTHGYSLDTKTTLSRTLSPHHLGCCLAFSLRVL